MKPQLLYCTEQLDGETIELHPDVQTLLKKSSYSKLFSSKRQDRNCFILDQANDICSVRTSYFIGIDWLERSEVSICIESKLNKEDKEIDFLSMLLSSVEESENLNHLEDLFQIDFNAPWIEIPKIKDQLSPFLIVQFLSLTQSIVRKGLKKSYYYVVENLDSRVKGKILIGQQIKKNIAQQKLTHTICRYQEYGINHWENQYLKTVLQFVSIYLENHKSFFSKEQFCQLSEILLYCLPAFETVSTTVTTRKSINTPKNAFYKEYSSAIQLGEAILKRFSYNITKAADKGHCEVPPFWIDMSKLFELYVFRKLKQIFPEQGNVTYHDRYLGGKETDILIKATDFKCVIDCKYKPKYKNEDPSLDDKRQLAGYTRLKSVYNKLGIDYNQIVKGLIIYSHQSSEKTIKEDDLFSKRIDEYIDFFKLGISLPEISC